MCLFVQGYRLRSLICSIFRVDFGIKGHNDESVLDSITSLGDSCPESPDVIGVPQSRCASSTDSDRSESDFMDILISQIIESFWVCVSPVFIFYFNLKLLCAYLKMRFLFNSKVHYTHVFGLIKTILRDFHLVQRKSQDRHKVTEKNCP